MKNIGLFILKVLPVKKKRMVATPENTHCIIGAREQSAATDKKAGAIMVTEPVFR